jgi:hypothetical protein
MINDLENEDKCGLFTQVKGNKKLCRYLCWSEKSIAYYCHQKDKDITEKEILEMGCDPNPFYTDDQREMNGTLKNAQ